MACNTTQTRPICVLVTGATGFLGKVVVEELLRQRSSLHIAQIICLVRAKRGQAPQTRFLQQMLPSLCFARLPDGWHECVLVVNAELSKPACGLTDDDCAMLQRRVTHIIHCAASVDFNRPVQEACTANIVSSLNVLELAQGCDNLAGMVSTSTAYVAVHRHSPIVEALEPLPRAADKIFADIMDGKISEQALLAETGHPNTYTYTKCIAEHMLVQRRGNVPLTIVRPSIISASWQYPFAGWIDSKAAFAGFVAMIGAGYLRLLDANPNALLDLVPVDIVAARLIKHVFSPALAARAGACDVGIVHAVSGRKKAAQVSDTYRAIVHFFRRNRTQRKPIIYYAGKRTRRYVFVDAVYRRWPAVLFSQYFGLVGNDRKKRQALRLSSSLQNINEIFPPFTHHTFDFVAAQALPDDYEPQRYVHLVCEGVYSHLMGQNASEILIGGAKHKARVPDLLWGIGRGQSGVVARAAAVCIRKIFKRVFDEITFDRASFDRATRLHKKDATYVIVPTHRSYLDYLICAYLFLQRADLKIAAPHVVAAPGRLKKSLPRALWRRLHLFSPSSMDSRAAAATPPDLQRLVDRGQNIQIFIEGERSRTRAFLPPQPSMLEMLKKTGGDFVVLPVSISYDRIAEESPFLREMKGAGRTSLSLSALGQWARRMLARRVHLGRVHLRCGAPSTLDARSDTALLGRNILAELQQNIVASTFHLKAFVDLYPEASVDVAWLTRAIRKRGGIVIDSPLVDTPGRLARRGGLATAGGHCILDPILERCMRHHWQHHFFADALAVAPDNVALSHYVASHQWRGHGHTPACSGALVEPKLQRLLAVLFEPVCRDYAAVAHAAQSLRKKSSVTTRRSVVAQAPAVDHANAQLAVDALLAGRLLVEGPQGGTHRPLDVAPDAALGHYATRCLWPVAGVNHSSTSRLNV